jgi:hypothetical protein
VEDRHLIMDRIKDLVLAGAGGEDVIKFIKPSMVMT